MAAGFLFRTVLVLLLIVLIGYFNEKVTKLTYEISLLLFSLLIGAAVLVVVTLTDGTETGIILDSIKLFDLEAFLMQGVLCFMLFAGSCHMRLLDFKRLARPVGVLAVFCTLLSAVFYGGLFYTVSLLLGLSFSLPMCLMFGSIVAPTDPLAATAILSKFGLPKDIGFLIEGESLLNDGVGVALFVCFSGLVTHEKGGGFFAVMLREILGAAIIGFAVTIVFFLIFRSLTDGKLRIIVSMLMVVLAYWLCGLFSCSGAIASVVCGVLFSALRNRAAMKGDKLELEEFDGFWEILDNLLNSVLYVVLGFSLVRILQMPDVILLSLCAILCNLASRFSSLFVSTFFMGPIPDGYGRLKFSTLFTWGGLKGGLAIALAMSASPMIPEDVSYIVLGCTYAIVFFTTVIQGLSMKAVYDRLRS